MNYILLKNQLNIHIKAAVENLKNLCKLYEHAKLNICFTKLKNLYETW